MSAAADHDADAPLEILYRDAQLIAVHKPPRLLVHRSALDRHATRFAVQLLRDQIGQRVWPAHRLDRGTSGVLLFALDADTAAALGKQFEAQTVAKRYLAVVRGHPPLAGVIDHPLTRQDDAVEGDTRPAQSARTHYRRLATVELPIRVDRYPSSRYALLSVVPETGRRHQIRRHLKHIAHPIIGDATHGKGRHNRMFAARFGCTRMLLACTALGFTHPVNGERITVRAPLEPEFSALLAALGWAGALDQPCSGKEYTGSSAWM